MENARVASYIVSELLIGNQQVGGGGVGGGGWRGGVKLPLSPRLGLI